MTSIDHHVVLASVHGVWNPALISHLAEQAGTPVRRRQLPSGPAGQGHLLTEDVIIDHWGRPARVSSFGTFDLQALIDASLEDPLDVLVLMLLPSEASRFDWADLARGWARLAWRGAASLLILSRAELDDGALAELRTAGLGISTMACGLRDHALAWRRICPYLVAPEMSEPPPLPVEPVVHAPSATDASSPATGALVEPPLLAGLVSQSWADDTGATRPGPAGRPSSIQAYLEPLLQVMGAIAPDDRLEELIITSTTRTEVILHLPADIGSGYTAAEFEREEVPPALARVLAHDLATTRPSAHG